MEQTPSRDSLGSAVLASASVLIGIGLLMLGNGLQGSLIGVRATVEQFNSTVIGFIMASYFVGFLVGSTWTPYILRQVEHIRVFAALTAVASVTILAQDLFVQSVVWSVMRFLAGLCFAGIYVVAESWLNSFAGNRTRGQLLAIYMVVMYAGLSGGQFLLNLAEPASADLFMIASGLISLAVVPMLLSGAQAPDATQPSSMSVRRLYWIAPFGVVGIFVSGLINGAVFGMGAVYAHDSGLSVSQVAWFMGAMIGGGAVLQWPLGRLSDVLGRRRVVIGVAFLAAALALVTMQLISYPDTYLLVGGALFGGLVFALHSLNIAHTNDWLAPHQMIGASSALMLMLGLGSIIGPLAAGVAMGWIGPAGFFWFLSVALIGLALFGMGCRRYYESQPEPEVATYVVAPAQGSSVVSAAVEDVYAEQAVEHEAEPTEP